MNMPLSHPIFQTFMFLLTWTWYKWGNKLTKGIWLHHFVDQNGIFTSDPNLKDTWFKKPLAISFPLLLIKSFHYSKHLDVLHFKSLDQKQCLRFPYLCSNNPFQISSSSFRNLQIHFDIKALLKTSTSLIQRPLQLCSYTLLTT